MKTVYVNKGLADPLAFPTGNLRGALTELYETNRYKILEEDRLENHSIYVVDYKQFIDIENYLPKAIHAEFQSFDDTHIYVMNDFGTDTEALVKSIQVLYNLGFDVARIWIQVSFNYEKAELESKLEVMGLPQANVFCYNLFLDMMYQNYISSKVAIDNVKKTVVTNPKKFTMFTRRFEETRFDLFVTLLDKRLLHLFEYTFTNLHPELLPYPHILITKDELKKFHKLKSVEKLGDIHQWIDGLPYHNGISDLTDAFADSLYPTFMKGCVNVVIETNSNNVSKHNIFLTEKTWKPILMGKPFLFFGPSGGLEILKKEGFKTFEPFIDESYDQSVDSAPDKIIALTNEVKRLSMLSDAEFFNIMNSTAMEKITKFNYKHLVKIANSNYSTSKKVFFDLFGINI